MSQVTYAVYPTMLRRYSAALLIVQMHPRLYVAPVYAFCLVISSTDTVGDMLVVALVVFSQNETSNFEINVFINIFLKYIQ